MANIKPVIAGNWKMHKGPAEARTFIEQLTPLVPAMDDRHVWLFPPAISISAARAAAAARPDLRIGVQNIHWESAGAFTGETSAPMARSAGASHVLVGHSERRHVFGETDDQTGRKVTAGLASGLHVVLCVGETLDQRKAGELETVLARQVEAALVEVEPEAVSSLTIAYEPVWAIGTGVNATPKDAAGAHAWVRECLRRRFDGDAASRIPILYGGSVKPDNAGDLMAASDVNGVLVGGASLDPTSFSRIVAAAG